MTTSVKASAHCATTKEVHVELNGELHHVLQDKEVYEFYVYDDRKISVKEVLKKPIE